MIESVSLRNWKAYDQLDVKLQPGTNFLVSRNGVGKTSFVEAISWALLGSDLSRIDGDSSRRGERDASVTLSMTWSDSVAVVVTRTVVHRATGKPREEVDYVVAGESGSGHTAWMSELSQHWNASGALLGRLMVMGEHSVWDELVEPVSADVNRAVRELLRLDALEMLATAAGREERRSEREAKAAPKIDEEHLNVARQQFEAARVAHDEEEAKVEGLRRLYQRRRDQRRLTEELAAWEDDQRQLLNDARAIALRISEDEGAIADHAAFEVAAEFVAQAVVTAERELAAKRTVLEMTERHSTELVADQDCPVCLRPLDEATVDGARTHHAEQIETIRRQVSTLEDRLAYVKEAKSQVDALRSRATRPRPVAKLEDDDVESIWGKLSDDELLGEGRRSAALVERLRDDLGVKRSALSALDDSSRAWAQSLLATRRQALAHLLRATAQSVSAELTTRAAEPLVHLVREQWKNLPLGQFLSIDDAGQVLVEREGRRLGYEALSGGEKAQVVLLYRVAALKALTRVPIFVLDEPLEHLDPRNRWVVGRMICALTSSGAFAQTLATTYEESLARRLALHSAGHPLAPVSVCYLSND